MSIFNSHGPCRGITLYSFKNKRAELWYIPANYKIIEHTHNQEDVELMFVFGKTVFYRRNLETSEVSLATSTWKMFCKCFSVKHFHSHWFSTSSWPLFFINFQTFLPGNIRKSAAVDFQPIH